MMRDSKELKDIYEHRYSNVSSTIDQREYDIYKKYAHLLIPSDADQSLMDLIDLGCGTGSKTIGFGEKFNNVVGVDLSEGVIDSCNKKFSNHRFKFIAGDAFKLDVKANVISAFGFSLFNTKIKKEYIDVLDQLMTANFKEKSTNIFIIGSFTDFSGKGEESWYLHTENELLELQKEIIRKFEYQTKIIFPHKLRKNYFGYGVYNFFAEFYKLIFKRKRTFFIVIDNGQRGVE